MNIENNNSDYKLANIKKFKFTKPRAHQSMPAIDPNIVH